MRAWLKTIVLVLLLFRMIPGSTAGEATPRSRPDPESGATTVRVGLYVLDITKIDNIDQSFTADCILRLRWADPRVGEAGARIALTDVWHPNVGIYNLRSHEEMFDESVVVLRDNVVQYTQRYYGDFSSVFDFHRFPFDVQSLPITLISFGNRPEEVELVIDAVGREERFSIPGWMIEQPRGEVSTIQADLLAGSSERIERPRLDFRLDARRYLDYYWWKVMIPLSIILMLSWAVFWIDPTQTGPQIAVSATSI